MRDSETREIQSLLNRVVHSGVHGLNVSYRRAGGQIQHLAAGLADVRTQRQMAVNSFHRIASVTKLFTATAVLQLMAHSRRDLDTPARAMLPDTLGAHLGTVTVRQLLNHTSGFGEPELQLFPSIRQGSLASVIEHDARSITPRELVALSLDDGAPFAPGERYWYSNTNYHLLGLILEEATGRDALDVIERQVIAPAGLANTFFPRGRLALPAPSSTGYDSLYQLVEPAAEITGYDMSCVYTAGALVSTPGDLVAFMSCLLGGDLLPRTALEQMTTTLAVDDGLGVGLGLHKASVGENSYYATEGVFFGAQTTVMSALDGSSSWVMTLNTTKYQALTADGWPAEHPADAAIAELGQRLTGLALHGR